MLRTLPNALTVLRLVLVPVMGYLVAIGQFGPALVVFLIAAVSDLLDGIIARGFELTSKFGATLDPIADKLNMFVATILLAWHALVPLWLAVAIVARDVVIVSGVIAYRRMIGKVKIAPSMLSKVNTFIEFSMLLLVMASAAQWISTDRWLPTVFLVTLATVVASGAQYVWVWGRKALRER